MPISSPLLRASFIWGIASSSIKSLDNTLPSNEILTNDLTYVIYSWQGYFGSANEVNENGFTFYTSIMGDLFQKHILYKDCKLIK